MMNIGKKEDSEIIKATVKQSTLGTAGVKSDLNAEDKDQICSQEASCKH